VAAAGIRIANAGRMIEFIEPIPPTRFYDVREWIYLLESRVWTMCGDRIALHVQGIAEESDGLWIQVANRFVPTAAILLHVETGAGPEALRAAFSTLRSDEPWPHRLELRRGSTARVPADEFTSFGYREPPLV
jgi:hypothetical protein